MRDEHTRRRRQWLYDQQQPPWTWDEFFMFMLVVALIVYAFLE